nr:MAG TPA_asm: hypothetical protein [Caudoviricetes sp.]
MTLSMEPPKEKKQKKWLLMRENLLTLMIQR